MKHLGVAILAFASFACTGGPGTQELEPVNAGISVLLVTIDTLRADHLGAYGYPRATSPNIDQLAAKGVVFDQAFTYWPKTRGSFASIFTSLYASQHGLTVRDRDLPEFNQTLAETFRDVGYRTAAAVDNANLSKALGFAQGFDEYLQSWDEAGTELERTELLTRFGEEFLATPREDDRPFFLWIHYVNPHTPYDPPEEHLARFRGDGIVARGPQLEKVVGYYRGVNRRMAIEGETHWGDYVDRYDAEIRVADEHVGRLLAALAESPWASTTLVLLTSDHGESLGEHNYFFDHGYDLFNPSLRIPLIVSFPGFLPQGERVAGAVTSLDIFPTMLDLAQVSFPPSLQGRSTLPLVRGTETRLHERLFFQNDQHLMAISNGRLKLIEIPLAIPKRTDLLPNFQLFDLARDPDEIEDRFPAAGPRIEPFKAELASFRTRTIAWQQKTTARRGGKEAAGNEQLSREACEQLIELGYVEECPSSGSEGK